MQSEDTLGNVVQTVGVDLAHGEDLTKAVLAAKAKGGVVHVIGELPVPHEIVRVKGLKYEVLNSDFESGRLLLQLMGLEDQADSHKERRHGKRRVR